MNKYVIAFSLAFLYVSSPVLADSEFEITVGGGYTTNFENAAENEETGVPIAEFGMDFYSTTALSEPLKLKFDIGVRTEGYIQSGVTGGAEAYASPGLNYSFMDRMFTVGVDYSFVKALGFTATSKSKSFLDGGTTDPFIEHSVRPKIVARIKDLKLGLEGRFGNADFSEADRDDSISIFKFSAAHPIGESIFLSAYAGAETVTSTDTSVSYSSPIFGFSGQYYLSDTWILSAMGGFKSKDFEISKTDTYRSLIFNFEKEISNAVSIELEYENLTNTSTDSPANYDRSNFQFRWITRF